jgi:hypothetical protein
MSIDRLTMSHQDRTAEKMPDGLLDNYRSFDKSLLSRRFVGSTQEQQEEINRVASTYEAILHNSKIQEVFAAKASADTIPEYTIRAIRGLIDNEQLPAGMMLKNTAMYSFEPLWRAAQVEEPDSDRRHYLESRTRNHLFRLLLPEIYFQEDNTNKKFLAGRENTVCPAFAKDFLRSVAEIPNPDWNDAKSFNNTIGAEGEAVSIFWTLAPYVNDELKRAGLLPQDSMQEIFAWIRDGYQKKKEFTGYDGATWEANSLAFVDRGAFKKGYLDFHLGFDERMPSHFLARLYAKSVTEQMIKKPL